MTIGPESGIDLVVGRIAHFGFKLLILAQFSGCGYALQTNNNPLLYRKGVEKIYINPVRNSTYQPGIDTIVYNAITRELLAKKKVVVVKEMSRADAVLSVSVNQAEYVASASTNAKALPPKGAAIRDESIATVYDAYLGCSFSLVKRRGGKNLWNSSFSRQKKFAGNNRIGTLGTTSALINDSEFERALSDLANNMMADVQEFMVAMF